MKVMNSRWRHSTGSLISLQNIAAVLAIVGCIVQPVFNNIGMDIRTRSNKLLGSYSSRYSLNLSGTALSCQPAVLRSGCKTSFQSSLLPLTASILPYHVLSCGIHQTVGSMSEGRGAGDWNLGDGECPLLPLAPSGGRKTERWSCDASVTGGDCSSTCLAAPKDLLWHLVSNFTPWPLFLSPLL